ncbi:hypothetical protein SDC9_142723 [bioreactor metagenome]|uniref:Uncharacterized protein n=1 Tax=bioreactor metagenome TaxID=1076179 RepID=A0A645E2F1_9ZZZZ
MTVPEQRVERHVLVAERHPVTAAGGFLRNHVFGIVVADERSDAVDDVHPQRRAGKRSDFVALARGGRAARKAVAGGNPGVMHVFGVPVAGVIVAVAGYAVLTGGAVKPGVQVDGSIVVDAAHTDAERPDETFVVAPAHRIVPTVVHQQRNREVVVVGRIERFGHAELFQRGSAFDGMGPGTRLVQRGQQHGGQNRDDRDYNQKFNQSEKIVASGRITIIMLFW